MGEIVLSQVGAAIGAQVLPNGLTVLGQSLSGEVLGRTIGSLAGRALDASMLTPIAGPRVKSLQIMESREGATLPLVFGRARVGGQVIWASRFKEYRRKESAGKGGPKYVEYTYSVSLAIALCDGPITRIDRVWANGEQVALGDYTWRLYLGDEAQEPDPLIAATEGLDEAPAYRGTAYIVFEDLPLDAFGNRLPQFSFEVVRSGAGTQGSLAATVKGVNIIPASGEFVYATSIVRERRFPGTETPLNMNNSHGEADFLVSLRQLKSDLPRVEHAALTVAWFGNDLRAGECRIRPGVERRDRETVPYTWLVDQADRESAYLISRNDERPNYGGTPADEAVIEGIAALNSRGIAVTLSPFLLMDVPPDNGLPDPYGRPEQPPFPWRGRIKTLRDGTAQASAEITDFVGEDGGYGFRHFILHHARLAKRAGGVDAFLIGSEMVALTRTRDDQNRFPFVDALIEIAREVRSILGASVKISYAADWTEYGAQTFGNNVDFPLDPLWADPAIDFIGLDWYPPTGDWRSGDSHLDATAGASGADDPDYIRANLAGGEAFDWYYADRADRDMQKRRPITDGAYQEPWIYRQKDLIGWWGHDHHPRKNGVRDRNATAWRPESKPLRLIELGYPAVDKGPNAPNVFYDPKSSESALPYYSDGARDDVIQRRALATAIPFWMAQEGVEQVLVWAWDGRPWPDFPVREDVWSDGPNWQFGHWLNGRSGLIELSEILEDLSERAGIALDAQGVSGVVDGYILDQVTSLASAIAPLSAGFDFTLDERQGQLAAMSNANARVFDLGDAPILDPDIIETKPLLDKRPSGLSLSYIGGDFSYHPASVTERDPASVRSLVAQAMLPIVMTESQARAIARNQYEALGELQTLSASFAPGHAWRLDIGDRVQFRFREWQVERLEYQALSLRASLRETTPKSSMRRALSPPDIGTRPSVPAQPDLILIDGPHRSVDGDGGLFAAVAAAPWPGRVPIRVGPAVNSLTDRAIARAPASIGWLKSDFGAGAFEGWDEHNTIHLEMPGASLASVDEAAILSGPNRVLLRTRTGWELIAWQKAELIGSDEWRLSRLKRGLNGSPIGSAETAAQVVLMDEALLEVTLSVDELGKALLWKPGDGDARSFIWQDLGNVPWRVRGLEAMRDGDQVEIVWRANGPGYAPDGTLIDLNKEVRFEVRASLNDATVLSETISKAFKSISFGVADQFCVAQVGRDGRRGEWLSIPLPSP